MVTIYDLQTLRKRKTCCYLDCDSPSIISMAFDTQGKFLLTQMGPSPSGKHDYTLIAWSWEKAKPIAATKVLRVTSFEQTFQFHRRRSHT